jgi:hypothetical protein
VKLAALLAAAALALPAYAQAPEGKPDEAKKEDAAKAGKKAKRPPRFKVEIEKNGRNGVGRDAAGGGPHTAEPSQGGTPGTPSGSFSR